MVLYEKPYLKFKAKTHNTPVLFSALGVSPAPVGRGAQSEEVVFVQLRVASCRDSPKAK